MAAQKYTMVFPASAKAAARRKSIRAISIADAVLQTRNAAMEQAVELWKGRSHICTLSPEG